MFTIWSGSSNHGGLDQPHHPCNQQYQHAISHPHPHLHPHPLERQNHIQGVPLMAREDLGHVEVLASKHKFIVKLDARGFSAEELEIKTLDGYLIIQGETGESGGEEFKTARKFSRRFLLPENCMEDGLQCELGGAGDENATLLKVTIPRHVPDGKGQLHPISVPRTPSYFTSPTFSHLAQNGYWVSGVECNKERFVLRLDLARFSPEEILVKTVDDYLVVEGFYVEKEDGSGSGIRNGSESGVLSSATFKRRYFLPLNANRDEMSCEINAEGQLKVVVPRINLGKTDQEKVHKVEKK